jgi:Carboxypeptidase regulatory-like domain
MKRAGFAFILLILVMGTTVFGQSTRGVLNGLVNDSSGASIAGASVVAKHVATGEEFRTNTDEQGAFVFPSVPLGKFIMHVEAAGFKRAEIQDIMVEVGVPATVKVPLEVGQVAESVVVTGDSQAVVNTTSPTLTNVINTRQVKDLPLQSRNPLDLVRLQAGIAVQGDNPRTANVGGIRGSGTNVTQDGINAMDNFVKTDSFFAITAPSLNSTSEFSVTVGTVGSDAGRGVAQVRMVTKSGTNDLHGSVFWQHRNDALNANTFFNNVNGTPTEIQRQNFFGGAMGGPIWLPKGLFGPAAYDGRDKSFWFFSYEGFREPFSVTRNRTVLTQQARNGIFNYTGANGQTQSVNLLQIGNFGTLNPTTTAQLNAMPLPNNTLIGDGLNTAGYQFNVKGSSPNDKWVGRFDQQLVENSSIGSHKLEFVVNYAKFLLEPDTFNLLEARFPGDIDAIQSSSRTLLTGAIQSTFGSRITNEVRVGHQRAPVGFFRNAPPIDPYFIVYPGAANVDQVSAFRNTFMSQGRNTLVYEYIDNFSVVSGAHTFRMGADIQSITALTFNDAGLNQTINIGDNANNPDGILDNEFPNLPAGATGTAITNRARNVYRDLVGLLGNTNLVFNVTSPTSGFVPGATRKRDFKQREVSLYFQDQWRARRNFTLNYGVRWEWQGVPYEVNGIAIQPVNGLAGLFGISGENNLFKPGVLQGQPTTSLDFVNGDTGKKLYNNDWNNFAPFIGIAYSPNFDSGPMRWMFGSEGKSSIRAGYSISYLHDGFTVVSNALGVGTTNPGLIQTAANNTPTGVLTAAGIPLATPSFKIPITDAENFAINSNNGLWTFDPNLRVPYVQQWSLGIEREIANNTAIEFRYVGNHAIKLFRAIDFNEVNIFENGFLQEFLNAQRNLAINGGSTFAPGAAGTFPLPTLTTLFAGLPAAQGFTNTGFINNLTNNNVGTMASTLAFSPTYLNTRRNLTPNFFVANPNAFFARGLTNSSFSNYHSLQAEIRRRLSRGLQLQANYTFSKAITDSDGAQQSTLDAFRTLRDLRLDRHRANFDQTHRFVANFIYELPFGTGRRWFNSGFSPLRKLVEGWQVGGIITWQTGPPISIYANRTTFNTANFNTTTGVIQDFNSAQLVGMSFDEFKDNVGIYRTPQGVFFFNPDLLILTTNPTTGRLTGARFRNGIFAAPAPGTFGNFPRNQINGPNFSQFDFSLTKRTRIAERGDFEFKATFYNAFNQPRFAFGPSTALANRINFDDALINFSRTTGSSRVIHFILGINF